MVNVDNAVIARIRKSGKNFEILVDCDSAVDFKRGKAVDLKDVLATESIFTDARKGLVAGGLKQVFDTEDILQIAEEILKNGEMQLTQEYKKKVHEQRLKKIIYTITSNAYDPRTNAPIPEDRLRLALEQAKVNVDLFKPEKEVIKEITESLKKILPISFEKRKLRVIVPAQYSMKAYSFLNKNKISENWLSSGDLECVIEVFGGMVPDVYDKLNSLTQGNVEIKEVN